MRVCQVYLVGIACWVLIVGCSRPGRVVVKDQSLRDFVAEFEVALADANGTLQSVEASVTKRSQRSSGQAEEEEDPPELQIRSVLQMVASSAEQVHRGAAGHAAEPDAKAILTDAQELLKKSQGRPNPTEVMQGIKQLSAKTEALKAKL